MIPHLRCDKRISTVLASSLLFLALLYLTWCLLLNTQSLLPVTSTTTSTKAETPPPPPRQVTCPAPLGYHNHHNHHHDTKRLPPLDGRNLTAQVHGDTVSVPRVVALIFYGRHNTVSILDCYLRRNLVTNGGLLDEVIWLRRTDDETDLKLLQRLLDSEPLYTKRDVDRTESHSFASAYNNLDDETLYIKIDDDVVFIDDDALLSLICTKISHPEYYIVSANVVNQPMISWLHWKLGAVHPYLPDTLNPYPKLAKTEHVDWRASKLPDYDGPEDLDVLAWNPPDDKLLHRWLPLRHHQQQQQQHHHHYRQPGSVLGKTPIAKTEYSAFGRGLRHWQIAAQQHYSLFENIESASLYRYMFNVWDFGLARVGIQFVAMAGRDINRAKPIAADDEEHFSVTMPRRLRRPAVADGKAIVAHYSFNPQSSKMPSTDILHRYRSYAREFICTGPMLWSPDPLADDG